MRILTFDTETTGLPDGYPSFYETERWPHIIQLSYSLYDTTLKKIIVENDHIIYLNDNVVITPKSVEMHKITREISQHRGIPIERALECFYACIQGADMLMAHNLSFDKRMLIVEHIRCKNRAKNTRQYSLKNESLYFPMEKDKHYYCTMKEGTRLCNIKAIGKDGEEYTKYPTLSQLHQQLFGSLPNQNAIHNSLVDVRLCLKCGMEMME